MCLRDSVAEAEEPPPRRDDTRAARGWSRHAHAVRAASFALVVLLVGAGCAPSSSGVRCDGPADCPGATCLFGRCRQGCSFDAECGPDGRCLLDTSGAGACAVAGDRCDGFAACASPLACVDGQCSNLCRGPIDCPADSACVPNATGVMRCFPRGATPPGGPVTDTSIRQIAAGGAGACALGDHGSVWCWGSEVALGDGASTASRAVCADGRCSPRPTPVSLGAGTLPPLTALGVSNTGAFALDARAALVGWSRGTRAAVIDGPGPGVASFVLGADDLVVLRALDPVFLASGSNAFSEIAAPASGPLGMTPVTRTASGLDTTLALGGHHGCVSNGGAISCWGENGHGEAGTAPSHHVETMTAIRLFGPATAMALADRASCALVRGEPWCWGDRARVGTSAMLASCDGGCTSTPVRVGVPHPIRLIGGPTATALCAEGPSRDYWCWGDNRGGALGRTLPAVVLDPVMVDGLHGATDVAIGDGFVCGLFGGNARCAGINTSGQLGRGSITASEDWGFVIVPP